MNLWHDDLDDPAVGEFFDPLCIQRSPPLTDEEAAEIEELCQTATPGPLVVDDDTEGEGAVVVGLPDGRIIVSRTAPAEHAESEAAARANAELICKARHLLLRLLHERENWNEQHEKLLGRIHELEVRLDERHTMRPQGGKEPHRAAKAR